MASITIPRTLSLTTLVQELLDDIIVLLDPVDLVHLSYTSKYFHSVVVTPLTWSRCLRRLASRDKSPPLLDTFTATREEISQEIQRISRRERNWKKLLVTKVREVSIEWGLVGKLASDGAALVLLRMESTSCDLWSLPNLMLRQKCYGPCWCHLISIAVSMENKVVLGGSNKGQLFIWPIVKENGEVVDSPRTFQGHTEGISCIDIPRDGTGRIVTGSLDRRVIVWDLATSARLQELDTNRQVIGVHLHEDALRTFHTDAHFKKYSFPDFQVVCKHHLPQTAKSRTRPSSGDAGFFFCASAKNHGVLYPPDGPSRSAVETRRISTLALDGSHRRVVVALENLKPIGEAVKVWNFGEKEDEFGSLKAADKQVEMALNCYWWGEAQAVAIVDARIVVWTRSMRLVLLEFD
ncbi:hypothetical protein BC936DRAFT_139318 [Jimgerdemannia flammicorona]|uniref:F-box domain-containing protein n=1 Tax=Jimgerdemannia flammicorona TaxID=994334 RepID=A0A433BA47_9FUNG|nr:hypothetical protein BC936DRAFT_139318 [Jimgerdemannia flammicorona]